MRFKTGFVVGCAAGFYLTQKARQLRAPLAALGGEMQQPGTGADRAARARSRLT